MTLPIVVSFGSLGCYLFLIGLIVWRNFDTQVNRFFVLYLTAMAFWQITALMVSFSTDPAMALFWYKLMYAGVTFSFILYFPFTRLFLRIRGQKVLSFLSYLVCLTILALVLFAGRYLIATVYPDPGSGLYVPQVEIGTLVMIITAFSFLVLAFLNLLWAFRRTSSLVFRQRTGCLMAGVIIIIGGSLSNFVGFKGYPMDIAANLTTALLIAYAIFRYKLFNIKVVLRKGVFYSLLTAIFMGVYLAWVLVLERYLRRVLGHPTILLAFLMGIVVTLVFWPLREQAQKWIDRLFFGKKYDFYQILKDFSHRMSSIINLEELTNSITDLLSKTMQTDKLTILLEKDNQLVPVAWRGLNSDTISSVKLRKDIPLFLHLAREKRIINQDELATFAEFKGLWKNEIAQIDSLKAEIFVPLEVKNNLVGLITLGKKQAGKSYSGEDLVLLSTLASQAAVALENAHLHKRTQESLHQAINLKEYNENLVSSVPLALAVVNQHLELSQANPVFSQIVARKKEEIKNKCIREFLSPQLCQRISDVIEKGISFKDEEIEESFSGRKKRIIKISALRLQTNSKEALVIIDDVTTERRLQRELIQAQRMESIGRLAGGVAHDFNNLLGGILGFAAYIKSKLKEDNPIYRDIDTIERSAKRGADLANQLLAFARKGKYKREPVNLNQITREVTRLLSRTIDKRVKIEEHLSEDLLSVLGDDSQIQQAILNICINAKDAMPEGGKLILRTRNTHLSKSQPRMQWQVEEGSYVHLSITDTGIGMSPQIKDQIFEPFFTTKGSKSGTGLGLPTAYGIIKNHGGHILVDSELGKGSTFQVYLPGVKIKTKVSKKLKIEVPQRGEETILLIDDEEIIREIGERVLTEKGYKVILASDAQQAIELYQEKRQEIDLVILDMIMPEANGREIYQKLKRINPSLRVLLSSGYTQEGEVQEIIDEGALGFIQKPYLPAALLKKVRESLENFPSKSL